MGIVKALIAVFFLLVFGLINVGQGFPQGDLMLEKMAADEQLQQELKWLKAETYVFTPSKVMNNPYGKVSVTPYDKYSPAIADYIAERGPVIWYVPCSCL